MSENFGGGGFFLLTLYIPVLFGPTISNAILSANPQTLCGTWCPEQLRLDLFLMLSHSYQRESLMHKTAKDSTSTPKTRHYTTMWNTGFQKVHWPIAQQRQSKVGEIYSLLCKSSHISNRATTTAYSGVGRFEGSAGVRASSSSAAA